MQITNLTDSPVRELPGRKMITLISPEAQGAENLSVCVISVAPGQCVRPAHRHPDGEETIYVMEGQGQVFARNQGQDRIEPLSPGTAVLFRPDDIHMVRNTSTSTMRIICFFAPAADPSTYLFYEDIEFPAI